MGIDDQLYLLPAQLIGHLEAFPLVGDGAVLADLAGDAVIEQFIEPGRPVAEGADMGQVLLIAFQRCLSGQCTMSSAVVNLLDPGPQAGVEVAQIAEAPSVKIDVIPLG